MSTFKTYCFRGSLQTGLRFPGVPHVGYSYQFWIETQQYGEKEIKMVQAQGNGGQLIMMQKEYGLLMVITAGNYNQPDLRKSSFDLFPDFILPAVNR